MLRTLLAILVTVSTFSTGFSQIFDPVSWSFSAERVSETEANLFFDAKIKDGWHLYSQFIDGDGPVPTSFAFQELGSAKLIGTINRYAL